MAIGERVAVWRAPGVEPAPRLRVLLPGRGGSVREQAMAAVFVPSVQQTGRRSAGRPVGRLSQSQSKSQSGPGPSRAASGSLGTRSRGTRSRAPISGRRTVVLPGDPTDVDAAFARWRGHPGAARTETDRAVRLGLLDGITQVGAAMIELGCWRTRISTLPPGPDLVAALSERPDELAPAPVTDPDQAVATARSARDAGVTDRVVTGWANAVLETITARARVLAWLEAEQYTDLAMLSRNYPGLAEMLPTEIGFALRTSDRTAGNAISTARTMTMRLPQTLEALRAGLIDSGHAMGLASATATTTAEVAAAVEADLLPAVTVKGSTITAEQLRRRAVRRVIALDPDGAADRHRKARKDRTMTRWAENDGMAGLKVLAPAEQIAAIWEAATGLADAAKTPGDPRTLGARRVDGLARVCLDLLAGTPPTPRCAQPAPAPPACGAPANGTDIAQAPPGPAEPTPAATPPGTESSPPNTAAKDTANTNADVAHDTADAATTTETTAGSTRDAATGDAEADEDVAERAPAGQRRVLPARHGRRPHIQVLVPYQVLLGSNDPCELAGHGAITADQARTIAADAVLQRILYDPTSGTVLDYGRTRYEPPVTLKQFIIARDRTCRTPGCLQPADRCQIDHIEPFRPGKPTGGRTNHTTLDGKCHHHHRAKDGGGFLNTRDPDGTTHWTTPLGRTYTLPPPQIIDPLEHQHTDNTSDTTDLDDQFPPELRKTTNFFLQGKTNPPGPTADTTNPATGKNPAAATNPAADDHRPDNATAASDSSKAAPSDDDPPF